jgi:hypothetical protein
VRATPINNDLVAALPLLGAAVGLFFIVTVYAQRAAA